LPSAAVYGAIAPHAIAQRLERKHMASPATEKVRQIGPYSKPHMLAKLDRRGRTAQLMERVRAELVAHVGEPSATQSALIDRASILTIYVAQFDAKALEAGGLSERDARQYLAYSNSLSRVLAQLGLKAAAEKSPSLAEHIAARRTAAAAAQ
jgi:hypothetical protein